MANNIIEINTTASTAVHTIALTALRGMNFPVKHQVTLEAFEAASTGTSLNVSSGVVTVKYNPTNSTAYLSMSDTIDLSSGPVSKLFSGTYSGFQFTHTMGTSSPFTIHYTGWME